MPGQTQYPLVQAGFVSEPAERFDPGPHEVVAVERDTPGDQGMRKPGVVVGEYVFEPAPVVGAGPLVRGRKLLDRPLE